MSTVPKQSLTEAEYLLRERRAQFKSEFYRGEMFTMAGATSAHELIAGNCFGLLWQAIRKHGCHVYKSDMKVRVSPGGLYTYPDVVAACGEIQFADEHRDVLLNPTVLIEVLSDSTADYDRGFKATLYRTIPSLKEYLLVEQDQPLIEHVRRQGSDTWLLRGIDGLEAVVELESVRMALKLADIFSQVEFPPKPRLMVHRREDAGP